MKSQIIKSLLIAVFVALTSHFAVSQDDTKIFYGRVVSVSPDKITISLLEGPTKGHEKSFTILKNIAVVNAKNLDAIEEGFTVYLRVDSAEEVCLVINVKQT